jgi:hypothetical protein
MDGPSQRRHEDLRRYSAVETNRWTGTTPARHHDGEPDNAWVRRVEFRGFAGGAVALWETTKWVTVEGTFRSRPVSESAVSAARVFHKGSFAPAFGRKRTA